MTVRVWLLAGVALVVASLVAVLHWYRGEAIAAAADRDAARAQLATAVAANKSLDEALERAREEAERRDRILLGFTQEIGRINEGVTEAIAGIRELENDNDEVRTLLGTRVPDALQLQLNR